MRDELVTLESTLSHAAARLYIHLLWRGGRFRTHAEIKRGAGIRDWRDFNRALAELEAKGLYDERTEVVWLPGVTSTPIAVMNTPLGVTNTPIAVASTPPVMNTPGVTNTPMSVTNTPMSVTNTPMSVTSTGLGVTSTPPDADNLEDAIADADAMPADGDERHPDSNFQLRRKRQIALLQQAWSSIFPEQTPLLPLTAKQWLAKARCEASTVLQAMQETASRDNVQSPRRYTDRIIEDVAKKRELTKREEQGELGTERPVTEAQRAEWDRMERLAKQFGIDWEDD